MSTIGKLYRNTKKILSEASRSHVFRRKILLHNTSRLFSLSRTDGRITSNAVTNARVSSACSDWYSLILPTDPYSPQHQSWIACAFMTMTSLLCLSSTDITCFEFKNNNSQCIGRTQDHDNGDDDDGDLTDHNFDGDDCEPIDLTEKDTPKKNSKLNALQQSIFGPERPKPKIDLEHEIQNAIQAMSDNISSSVQPERVAQQMKVWMDQMIPVSADTQSKNRKRDFSNEDGFQNIIQCLFDIVMDATNVMTESNNEEEKENFPGKAAIEAHINKAVSDLLEAVQKRQINMRIPDFMSTQSSDTDTPSATLHLPPSVTEDTTSIFDLCHLLVTYSDDIQQLVAKHMSNIDYQRITPTAIAYYADYANTKYQSMLEKRLQHHNSAIGIGRLIPHQFLMQFRTWQQHQKEQVSEFLNRQQHGEDADHRTAATPDTHVSNTTTPSTIDPSILEIIAKNPDAIALAQLAYADTIDQLREGLQNLPSNGRYQYELMYCDLKSEPGKPSHFYFIRSDTNKTEPNTTLDVVVVIRGTKTVADAITDLLCDTQPYHRWGKAHSHILESGRYIANFYRTTFEELLHDKKKNIFKIDVTIYGHSLGAGAGAIAAMELHNLNDSRIHVHMIGYGCPAILSKNLAAQTSDYITTFINDSDIVPRLSGLSLTNLLYDIIEFDWMPFAQKDVQNVFNDLQQFQPILFNADTVTTMKNIITPILESIHKDTYIPSGTIPRLDVELFPPGKCIHIYRTTSSNGTDDSTIHRSACYVPNWFYSQIDVNKHMIDDHLLASGYIVALTDIQRQME